MAELFKVTNEVVMLWVAAGLTLLMLGVGTRLIVASPVASGRFANLVEAMVDFVRGGIVEEFLGEHSK
jgi:F0F1-type ATP synthase membrane subunit a